MSFDEAKSYFHCKAKMLTPEEVEGFNGHSIGGVCPFGIKENVRIFLDDSLKRFDIVYPACGSGNSAVKLSCEELEVCKSTEGPWSGMGYPEIVDLTVFKTIG